MPRTYSAPNRTWILSSQYSSRRVFPAAVMICFQNGSLKVVSKTSIAFQFVYWTSAVRVSPSTGLTAAPAASQEGQVTGRSISDSSG